MIWFCELLAGPSFDQLVLNGLLRSVKIQTCKINLFLPSGWYRRVDLQVDTSVSEERTACIVRTEVETDQSCKGN
jgi:hypothetical protein